MTDRQLISLCEGIWTGALHARHVCLEDYPTAHNATCATATLVALEFPDIPQEQWDRCAAQITESLTCTPSDHPGARIPLRRS
jgi:hypothetical protein